MLVLEWPVLNPEAKNRFIHTYYQEQIDARFGVVRLLTHGDDEDDDNIEGKPPTLIEPSPATTKEKPINFNDIDRALADAEVMMDEYMHVLEDEEQSPTFRSLQRPITVMQDFLTFRSLCHGADGWLGEAEYRQILRTIMGRKNDEKPSSSEDSQPAL